MIDLSIAEILGGFETTLYLSAEISPNLSKIALYTGYPSSDIFLQDLQIQSENGQLVENLSTYSMAFSQDGQRLAAGGYREVTLWDIGTFELLQTLTGYQEPIQSLAFSSDNEMLATGSKDATVRLWRLQDQSDLSLEGHTKPVVKVAFSTNGERLASASEDRSVRVWQTEGNAVQWVFDNLASEITSLAFSPGDDFVAAGTKKGMVYLWRLSDGELLWRSTSFVRSVDDLIFHHQGEFIAITSVEDMEIKFLAVDGGATLQVMENLPVAMEKIYFSQNGKLLVSLSRNAGIYYWGILANETSQ